MIEREEHEGVTVLRLAHGKANALDLELCGAITTAFEEAGAGDSAVVLTGTGNIFSAGVDLVRLVKEGESYVRTFLPTLARAIGAVISSDRPVVAAINGHAIAGGCILAAACDLRIMADGKGRIGVPELLVGVPFPSLAIDVLRNSLPVNRQREVMLTGQTWTARDAMDRGLIDRVSSSDKVLEDAIATAREMGAIAPKAFSMAKDALLRPVRDLLRLPESNEIMEQWTAPASIERITAYLDRTVKKK